VDAVELLELFGFFELFGCDVPFGFPALWLIPPPFFADLPACTDELELVDAVFVVDGLDPHPTSAPAARASAAARATTLRCIVGTVTGQNSLPGAAHSARSLQNQKFCPC
jgi:hypothetical protein